MKKVTPKKKAKRLKVNYGSLKMRNFITEWIENAGWKLSDFPKFMRLMGIESPVKLAELNEREKSVKCSTASQKEFTLILKMGDYTETSSKIIIVSQNGDEEERRWYKINNKYQENDVPKVILYYKIIKKEEKSISFDKRENEKIWFRLGEKDIISVEFYLPKGKGKKDEDVKEYLFSLKEKASVCEVYEKLVEIYKLSDEEISNMDIICIKYASKAKNETLMKEDGYWTFKIGDEFFIIKKNGEWKYKSEEVTIKYSKRDDKYHLDMNGNEADILNLDIPYLFAGVTKQKERFVKYCI